MKKQKNERKIKGLFFDVMCGIGVISISTSIAKFALTGLTLNSLKSLSKTRITDSYIATKELDEVNMEYYNSFTAMDYFTTYNSYNGQDDRDLIGIVKCLDGTVSNEELNKYLNNYYEEKNVDIESISVQPDKIPVYAIYK